MYTNKDNPNTPSQAAIVKKNNLKYLSDPTPDIWTLINQKIPNIMNSKLNNRFNKCLWYFINLHNPQPTINRELLIINLTIIIGLIV